MNTTTMQDFGAVLRGMGHNALEIVFNAEWIGLSESDARLVLQDFLEASQEGVTANQYARRIGRGNLQAYADTMQARFRNGW